MGMCADWTACSRCFLVDYYGDPGETRTPDILLRRQALYPLSYRAGSSILATPGRLGLPTNSFEGCCSIH